MLTVEISLRRAAWLIVAASVLGPGAVFLDAAVNGATVWTTAADYVAHARPAQLVPPLLGFPLLVGFVLFVSAAKRLDERRGGRVDQTAVLLLTAIYGALVAFNYIANGAWVFHARDAELGGVAVLSMANPRSLCWAIELFAYAILGVVTWLIAPTFAEERAIAALLRANGGVSVLAAAVAVVDLTWVQSPVGLAFYAAWNVLIIAIGALVLVRFPVQRAPAAA